jgi:hypothetical protein
MKGWHEYSGNSILDNMLPILQCPEIVEDTLISFFDRGCADMFDGVPQIDWEGLTPRQEKFYQLFADGKPHLLKDVSIRYAETTGTQRDAGNAHITINQLCKRKLLVKVDKYTYQKVVE